MFIKNYNRLILILILLLFLTQYTNFFKNLRNIYLYNYDSRIAGLYGFCERNSLGFLLYIKEKYKLDHYPEIINYKIVPSTRWVLDLDGKIKTNKNLSYLILLNYQDDLKANLKLISKNFYIIPNQQNNIGIKNIKIKLEEKEYSQFYDINIKLFQSNFKNNKVIYSNNFNKIVFQNGEADIDLNFYTSALQDSVLRTYILIESRSSSLKINNIILSYFNKYNIDKKKVIEKSSNCYFLRK